MVTRILIADDNAVCRRLLQATLSDWGYQVTTCNDGVAAVEELTRPGGPRIAIIDWVMPNLNGVDVCRTVRNHRTETYIYMILLTAQAHHDHLVTGLAAGADDFVNKPFDPEELCQRVRAAARIIELQDRLVATQQELRVQATTDALTGVCNRSELLAQLREAFQADKEHQTPLSLAMIDVDSFKQINDTHGHPFGDQVLREMAQRVGRVLRPQDIFGRYGGDEFVVGMPATPNSEAAALMREVHEEVSGCLIRHGEQQWQLDLSIGLATAEPFPSGNLKGLLSSCDAALYRAKNGGRNQVANVRCHAVAPAPGNSSNLQLCQDGA